MPPHSPPTSGSRAITGLVLAGGAAARMAGADKGLLPLDGRPLAAHVLAQLAPQVGALLISANRHLDDYAALGAPVVTDPFADGRGPLAGMLAGLEAARSEWLLCVPCDMPRLPEDLASTLLAAAEQAGADAAYARSGDDAHYTCCLLRRSLAPRLRQALVSGTRAVRDFLREVAALPVMLAAPLPNLNTPQALAAAARA